jgi:hypothetical protein
MSAKHVLFRSEAREKVLRGASLIADAVRVTLGPKSKCVLIDRSYPHRHAGEEKTGAVGGCWRAGMIANQEGKTYENSAGY